MDTSDTNGNPVQDEEIARRRANEGLQRKTPLEHRQGLQDEGIERGGLSQLQPQPALPDETTTDKRPVKKTEQK